MSFGPKDAVAGRKVKDRNAPILHWSQKESVKVRQKIPKSFVLGLVLPTSLIF